MDLKINPSAKLKGIIDPPASKSYTIRAFVIASLGGKSKIINPSNSIDCQVAIASCKYLGAKIKRTRAGVYLVEGFNRSAEIPDFQVGDECAKIIPTSVGKLSQENFPTSNESESYRKPRALARGDSFQNKRPPKFLNVKESGATLRFLISLVSLFPGRIIIHGSGTLKSRPNKPLVDVLKKLGLEIKGTGPKGTVPITVEGKKLKGRKLKIDGTLSSQFISSLLITCPNFSGDTRLKITGDYIVSKPYIDMTLLMLKQSSIKIKKINNRNYLIYGDQRYKGLGEFNVPPDYGLSAFFMAAASLVRSDIFIRGLTLDNLIQADKKILYFLKKMGVNFIKLKDGIKIKGPFKLKGNRFLLRDSPDLVPVLGILGLFAKGTTRLCGIKHVRVKESNRISNFREELLKLGARVYEKEDELIIYPSSNLKRYIVVDPHNDHRLAMAFCVLGLTSGIVVKNIECISKSYPNFLSDLKKISAKFSKG